MNAIYHTEHAMIDKKTFWIGILTVVAAVFIAAHAILPLGPSEAFAREVVDSRDYQMVTAESADGGQVLYVLEKRSGFVALIVWDPNTRTPTVVNIRPLQAAFAVR